MNVYIEVYLIIGCVLAALNFVYLLFVDDYYKQYSECLVVPVFWGPALILAIFASRQ